MHFLILSLPVQWDPARSCVFPEEGQRGCVRSVRNLSIFTEHSMPLYAFFFVVVACQGFLLLSSSFSWVLRASVLGGVFFVCLVGF